MQVHSNFVENSRNDRIARTDLGSRKIRLTRIDYEIGKTRTDWEVGKPRIDCKVGKILINLEV